MQNSRKPFYNNALDCKQKCFFHSRSYATQVSKQLMQFDAQIETATLWYAGCCNLNMQWIFRLQQWIFRWTLVKYNIVNNNWLKDERSHKFVKKNIRNFIENTSNHS